MKMAKFANAGALRTPIRFTKTERVLDNEGYYQDTEVDVLITKCRWQNVHGVEVFTAMQQQLREPATITMRYSEKVDRTALVYKGKDTHAYEVISIDNVEERNEWLEIKVQRKMLAV